MSEPPSPPHFSSGIWGQNPPLVCLWDKKNNLKMTPLPKKDNGMDNNTFLAGSESQAYSKPYFRLLRQCYQGQGAQYFCVSASPSVI